MNEQIQYTFTIEDNFQGSRLDLVLSQVIHGYSRSIIQKWIANDMVKLNKKLTKASAIVNQGDYVEVNAVLDRIDEYLPKSMDFNKVYEDEDILVINKPKNTVVHPGAGNYENTLLNGLISEYPNSVHIPRAGILHRLDKDTTGLMVVAKNLHSYNKLTSDLKEKRIARTYHAICHGIIKNNGTIIAPIGRHPTNRIKMAVTDNGKYAETRYEIIRTFNNFTHVQLNLVTGRTHQIRVHLSHMGHHIVGDQTYRYPGSQDKTSKGYEVDNQLTSQALHAIKLELSHPSSAKKISFSADLPEEMQNLLEQLD